MKREEYLAVSAEILDGVTRYDEDGNRVVPEETIQSLRAERDELKRRNAELEKALKGMLDISQEHIEGVADEFFDLTSWNDLPAYATAVCVYADSLGGNRSTNQELQS